VERALRGRLGRAREAGVARTTVSWPRFSKCLAIAVLSAVATTALLDAAVATWFPRTSRLDTSFTPDDLRREISEIRNAKRGETLFLGDSLLWGFQVAPDQTAVAVLAKRGCACRNLAYKHGSPPNYYALVRALQSAGVRPRALVVEVNRELFSSRTGGYRKLADSIGDVSAPYLTPEDRSALDIPRESARTRFDRALASVSLLYAKRVDIHIAVYGDTIAPFSADLIRRLYDLPPLDERNLSVRYLEKTLDLLHGAGTPVVAFLAPINHAAIDAQIDPVTYRRNTAFLVRMLASHGAQVVNLDSAFPKDAFLDEQHLTPQAHVRLASILGEALRRAGVTPYAASTSIAGRPRSSGP
jgi:hypothetical protein